MKVLDLFSGLGGWSKAFLDRGHEVVTVDIEQSFNPTICADMMDVDFDKLGRFGVFDVVLASPPCNCFSVMAIRHYWKKELGVSYPRNENVLKSLELVKHTLRLIEELNPRFWIMENPTGMLRKQPFMKKYEMKTVTQCQYGREFRKSTDLWGVFPRKFIAKTCKNRDGCHQKTTRDHKKRHDEQFSRNGLQDQKHKAQRALIPYGLSMEMCLACESGMAQPIINSKLCIE